MLRVIFEQVSYESHSCWTRAVPSKRATGLVCSPAVSEAAGEGDRSSGNYLTNRTQTSSPRTVSPLFFLEIWADFLDANKLIMLPFLRPSSPKRTKSSSSETSTAMASLFNKFFNSLWPFTKIFMRFRLRLGGVRFGTNLLLAIG